jgi:phosphatidylglycerophosphate synthase
MLDTKQLADMLTLSRILIALGLAWLGFAQGAAGLPRAVWLMIADWTGDCLDGALARRSRNYRHTWLGDHDLEADMIVSGGLLVYMLLAGYVDLWLGSAYLLVWAFVFWRWGLVKVLGLLFQAPIYGWFICVALWHVPAAGWWLLAWITAAIIITWPKFPREVIPGFLSGMRQVGRGRSHTPR